MLYARRGRLPKGVKSPQPKTDRKGQSQTVQTLRAQHPLKYLLHIANLPKSSFYYHHQDRPDPDEADKALLVETYRRHKGRYGQRRIAAALDWNRKKAARLMKQMGLKAKIRAKKAYRHPAMGEISEHVETSSVVYSISRRILKHEHAQKHPPHPAPPTSHLAGLHAGEGKRHLPGTPLPSQPRHHLPRT
ncbi:hypothetical protein NM96_00770 [Neisseria mucosa]|uniref:IS3 family transposase n=1 Tax=Neisseria mucosa TaxID=488 RepID=UPI000D17897B|nr:hypothetical protein NM96_00770 [Neisseria mucosa]